MFSNIVRVLMEKPPSFWAPGMETRRDAYVFTVHMQIGVRLSDVRAVITTGRDGRRKLVVSNDGTCSCSGRTKVSCKFPLPGNADLDRSKWRTKVYKEHGAVKITIPKC